MPDYASIVEITGTFGLIFFIVLFALVLVYALRPRNKQKFDQAARIPLEED
jgi:cytochrome c oxidase cbb3-type subunit 4